jgi:hypothetical protein
MNKDFIWCKVLGSEISVGNFPEGVLLDDPEGCGRITLIWISRKKDEKLRGLYGDKS